MPHLQRILAIAAGAVYYCAAQPSLSRVVDIHVHCDPDSVARSIDAIVVVTHAMLAPVRMTVSQMQEAAQEGAFIEFVYNGNDRTKPRIHCQ